MAKIKSNLLHLFNLIYLWIIPLKTVEKKLLKTCLNL